MPIYTYRCDNCGVQFDRFQHFDDKPLTRCPECNKEALHKVYQPVGIVFKGSGFYATDHRSPSGMTSTKRKEETTEKGKNESESEKASSDSNEE